MPNVAVDELEAVDLERLVVLVRVRRGLRVLARVAVLALVIWFVVLVTTLGVTTEGSSVWTWFNDHGNRGFVIILAVLAAVVLLVVTTRLAGPAGRVAARFAPMVRRVPDAEEVRTPRREVPRRLALGSRSVRQFAPGRSRSGTWALAGAVVAMALIALITAVQVPGGYRAGHGYGGPVVTIGKDTTLSKRLHERATRNCDYPGGDYYVSSSVGEALVESDCARPKNGARYVITDVGTGLHAIRVGSSHWVSNMVIAIVAFLLGLTALIFLGRRFAGQVPDPQVEPLAETVDRTAKGRRVPVCAVPRRHPERAGAPVALTVRIGRDAGTVPAGLRRATLRCAGAIALLLVAVGLAVAYG